MGRINLIIKYKQKKKIIGVTPMIERFRTMSSGATIAFPPSQINTIEIEQLIFGRLRPEKRFNFLGEILTKPNDNEFVLGLSYKDQGTDKPDEDFYLFTEEKDLFSLEKLKPRDVERRFPDLYKNYHHGDKSFFESLKLEGGE